MVPARAYTATAESVAIAAIAVAGAVARSTSSGWGTFMGQDRGQAAQIAELEATRTRLREDRQAGLYDDADDAE
jgi:Spy/CpxP family protein refolding chaperone